MKRLCIVSAIITAGLIYFFFNPADYGLFPKCPFYTLTGFTCPGCGSQRAIYSLLHLDLVAAFKYNALLVSSLPLIAALGYAEWNRVKHPAFYAKMHQVKLIWVYFFIVILWWIGRNIGGV